MGAGEALDARSSTAGASAACNGLEVAELMLREPAAAPRAARLGRFRQEEWELLDPAALLACLCGAAGARTLRGLLERADLLALSRARPGELEQRFGLRPADALRVAAAFELGRKLARHAPAPREPLHSAQRVEWLLHEELRGLERETFHVLLLDGKHRLKAREVVSVGTLTTSLVHPREVFRAAVREAAAAVICAHNHPSGDPEPSPEDLEVTRRLLQAGKLLGIPVLDHVVIGEGKHVSLRERMGF